VAGTRPATTLPPEVRASTNITRRISGDPGKNKSENLQMSEIKPIFAK
jgi:hypothetical protein